MACKQGGCGMEPPWYRILVDNHKRTRSTVNWLLIALWCFSICVAILFLRVYKQQGAIEALIARVEALECPAPVTNLSEPPPAAPKVK